MFSLKNQTAKLINSIGIEKFVNIPCKSNSFSLLLFCKEVKIKQISIDWKYQKKTKTQI